MFSWLRTSFMSLFGKKSDVTAEAPIIWRPSDKSSIKESGESNPVIKVTVREVHPSCDEGELEKQEQQRIAAQRIREAEEKARLQQEENERLKYEANSGSRAAKEAQAAIQKAEKDIKSVEPTVATTTHEEYELCEYPYHIYSTCLVPIESVKEN